MAWLALAFLAAGPRPLSAQGAFDHLVEEATRGPRVPVLLVPGWSDEAEQLAPLRSRLVEAGWADSTISILSFEDPVGSNRIHARSLGLAVASLRRSTGVDRIDVVAHSMGGLALRHFLQNGGAREVRRVVFLATPHRGTYSAYLAWGEGGKEMYPGSLFLLALASSNALPDGVEGITVRTPADLHVLPPESATLPPLPDLEVCCPTHAGLLDHEETFQVIEAFLRHPR
jgi:triacylglycerol lipase